jgi:chromosome segregation ATPase
LNVDDAQYIRQQADKYNQNINDTEGGINAHNKAINDLNASIKSDQAIIDDENAQGWMKQNARTNKADSERKLAERQQALNRDAGYLQSQREGRDIYLGRNQPILDKLNTYNQNVGLTRQQLLNMYDKDRLARVQALQSLSGLDLSSLLSQGVS